MIGLNDRAPRRALRVWTVNRAIQVSRRHRPNHTSSSHGVSFVTELAGCQFEAGRSAHWCLRLEKPSSLSETWNLGSVRAALLCSPSSPSDRGGGKPRLESADVSEC